MGLLSDQAPAGDIAVMTLRARHLVGRSGACHLRLTDRSVSGEHAVIRWSDGAWWVRDLGSTNGTFVDEVRVTPGQDVRLSLGSALRFGAARTWVLADLGGPRAHAARVVDDHVVEEADGLLALPSADDPSVVIVPRVDGTWVVQREDGAVAIRDLDPVEVDGSTWVSHLTAPLDQTLKRGRAPILLPDADLTLKVSADEEHVEVSVRDSRSEAQLKPLAHWYAVLTLARARLESPDGGWIDREQLCRMLRVDRNGLNVQLYRARRQLMRKGVEGVDQLIERRGSKLRLGLTRVVVERLA